MANTKYTPRHESPVRCIDTGAVYDTIREASIECRIGEDAISQCCRKRQKTAGGLLWEYCERQKESLCWTCSNCYGGCSWTEWDPEMGAPAFAPVSGWEAHRQTRLYGGNLDVSYTVVRCPQYIPDER